MKKKNFEIFVYHRIGNQNTLDGLMISKETFDRQMKFLKQSRRPMALARLINLMRSKKPIPENAVAVTFDDGYKDTYQTALPILKKWKIPATVFITTGFMGKRGHKNAAMMSWQMVRKLSKAGIEIGAHTMTHPNLINCSPKEVYRQINGSKRKLEEKLGKRIRFFAYPYGGPGSVSPDIMACAKKCGYEAACTTIPGKNSSRTHLFALKRQPSLPDEIRVFALQIHKAAAKSKKTAQISGFNPEVLKIWKNRYWRQVTGSDAK